MTKTCGYYNGNKWPIQLVISSLNVTLHLQPGEFVKDRAGRKINDPLFDAYAKNRQLFRETSSTPVPLLRVPAPSSKPAPHDGQSVRQITEFTHTAAGVRVPVIPQPRNIAVQAVNKNSVQAMTIEQARKSGLVHRTREVPESYGITDTDSALPPRLPPPLKVATDMKPSKPVSLPEGLLAAAAEDVPAGRAALVQQLSQKVPESLPEEDDEAVGFMNAVTHNAPPDVNISTGPETPVPSRTKVPRNAPQLPEPELAQVDEPPAEDEQDVALPAPRQVTPRNKYVCSACGLGFPFRSQLERHAISKHKDDIEAILSVYPNPR